MILYACTKAIWKKTWETIKRVINKFETKSSFFQFLVDSVLSDDYKVIAEKFNHYFASIGSDLAKKFPNVSTDIKKFLSGNYAQSFFSLDLCMMKKFVISSIL